MLVVRRPRWYITPAHFDIPVEDQSIKINLVALLMPKDLAAGNGHNGLAPCTILNMTLVNMTISTGIKSTENQGSGKSLSRVMWQSLQTFLKYDLADTLKRVICNYVSKRWTQTVSSIWPICLCITNLFCRIRLNEWWTDSAALPCWSLTPLEKI